MVKRITQLPGAPPVPVVDVYSEGYIKGPSNERPQIDTFTSAQRATLTMRPDVESECTICVGHTKDDNQVSVTIIPNDYSPAQSVDLTLEQWDRLDAFVRGRLKSG